MVVHYDQHDRLIAETGLDGSARITYLWRDQVVQAIVFHGPPARTVWLQHDHLGTPRRAYGQDGRLVWRWHSDAYGTTPADPDPEHTGMLTPIALRLPGQYHDPESGLHYNWHRYYSPRLARYLSPDPIGVEGGGNLFAYVGGRPLSRVDPEGLAAGDHYGSQHAAAAAAMAEIHSATVGDGYERGGMVYYKPQPGGGAGWYSYTEPRLGDRTSVDPGGPASCPDGTTPRAYYHSHPPDSPGYAGSEWFSPEDVDLAKRYRTDAYVVTGSGNRLHYSRSQNRVRTLP